MKNGINMKGILNSAPTIASIIFLLFLAAIDIFLYRRKKDAKSKCRVTAFACGIALLSLELALTGTCSMNAVSLDLFAVAAVILSFPLSASVSRKHLCASLALFSVLAVLVVVDAFLDWDGSLALRKFLAYLFLAPYLMAVLSVAPMKRFSNIRQALRPEHTWTCLDEISRATYMTLLLCIALLGELASALPGLPGAIMSIVIVVMLAGILVLAFHRSFQGISCMIPVKKEMALKQPFHCKMPNIVEDKPDENAKMESLFSRIEKHMKEKQPFLNAEFKMDDLAHAVYSNKMYLSRTINMMTEYNFRQYVNSYRIDYAKTLFRKDPSLRVSEVGMMSGFNTAVSFNVAFKLHTGKTPTEWIQEVLSA